MVAADSVQDADRAHPQGLPAAYHCWLELPGELQRLPASLEEVAGDAGLIHCQAQQVGSCPIASPATGRLLQPLLVPGPQGLVPFSLSSLMRPAVGRPGRAQERGAHSPCWEMRALNNGTHSGRSILEEAGGGQGVFRVGSGLTPPSTHSSSPPWPSGSSQCPSTSPGARARGWTMPALFMVSLGAAQQAGQGVQLGEAPQSTT